MLKMQTGHIKDLTLPYAWTIASVGRGRGVVEFSLEVLHQLYLKLVKALFFVSLSRHHRFLIQLAFPF